MLSAASLAPNLCSEFLLLQGVGDLLHCGLVFAGNSGSIGHWHRMYELQLPAAAARAAPRVCAWATRGPDDRLWSPGAVTMCGRGLCFPRLPRCLPPEASRRSPLC